MVRLRTLVIASALALGTLVISPAASAAETFSKAVGKPLQAAQEAIKARRWDTALDRLKEAQAVPGKKPHEQYAIDQMMAYVLYTQKNYAEAAPVYERLIESGRMPAAAVQERTKAVAQMYFQLKNYGKAIEWSQKSLRQSPNQQDMQVMLGQSYYLTHDYKNAVDAMSKLVAGAERAGQVPKEEWLRIVQASQLKLGARERTVPVLEKLVRYHNKPEDWEMLLDIKSSQDHGDRVSLGYYRLMLDVNALKNPADYVEAAQLAMDAKVPALARTFIEKGMENGVLKTTDPSAQGRYQRLSTGAASRIEANKTELATLTPAAPVSPQGEDDVLLGRIYLSYDKYDEAIAALSRGLKKPGVADPDEARVALGIAYLRKGQKDLAAQAFRSVPKNSPWADLAGLWALRV